MEVHQEAEDPLTSCHQAEGGDLKDTGEKKQVPAYGGRQIPSQLPAPSHLPLHNRYGAPELEGQATEEVGPEACLG